MTTPTARADLRWEPLAADPSLGVVVVAATGRVVDATPVPLADAAALLSPTPIRVRIR